MGALRLFLRSLSRHHGRVAAIEYVLIAALIAVTIMLTAATVGKQLAGFVLNVGASLAGVPLTEPDAR